MSKKTWSYYHSKTNLSVLVPNGWKVNENESFDFMVIGPEKDQYSSNVGFKKLVGFENLDQDLLAKIIVNTQKDQLKDYNDFKELKTVKKMLNQHPIWLQHYTWTEELTGTKFSQLLCLGALDPETLIEIHAATLLGQEKEMLPELLQIIESFRYIPD